MPFDVHSALHQLSRGGSSVAPHALARAAMLLILLGLAGCNLSATAVAQFPEPALDVPLTPKQDLEAAVFAGGCFWGVEAVFQHVKGVRNVVSGYSGGSAASAN